MNAQGVILFNSSFIGSSVATAQKWNGGPSVLVVDGDVFGAGCLQFQVMTGLNRWIPVCSTILAPQLYRFDAPAGQYRVCANQSSAINVNAALVSVQF